MISKRSERALPFICHFLLVYMMILGGSKFVRVQATSPNCAAVPANISYVNEDCFNATHRQVHKGKCINGVAQDETVSLVGCNDYTPIPGTAPPLSGTTNQDFFCHECQDHRVVCSELQARPQACAAHVNDDTFCRQVQSTASFSGCLSLTHYFSAIEYCDGDDASASITPQSCAEDYGEGFSRCMSCKDGLLVCAGTDTLEECEEIGLPSPPATDSNEDGDGGSNGGSDNTIDGSEQYGTFDCTQFWGDAQFYGVECFNQTHQVVTSGLCVEGQVQGLSFRTSPCSENDQDFQYCHDCNGKAVCSDTPIKFNLCDENEELRTCSSNYDRSSALVGCADEQAFILGSDSCSEGSGILTQQTVHCGGQFQGLPFCIYEESSNFQLCSSVPPVQPPPIECETTESDALWSKYECFNATHTLYRSGKCIGGKLRAPVAKIEACGGYCHQCSDSTAVCSMSDNPDIACIPPVDGSACEGLGLVSATEGCVDDGTTFRETKSCNDGQIQTDRSEQKCATRYFDTPKCLPCSSASFCATEEDTCTTFGSAPATTRPGPRPGTADGIACPPTAVKVNYYKESCYNSTHVRLLQGECDNGNKAKTESMLLSCTEYGEDDSRMYCHECGVSLSCSNMAEKSRACERQYHDRTCNDNVSDLSGVFGCLDEKVFFTDFAVCSQGRYASESNGFRCAEAFPGHSYCNTCGSLNLCTDQAKSCSELGF